MDNLLYALLKEALLDFIVETREKALEKLSYEDAPGSMMKDLLTAVNRNVGKRKNRESSPNKDNLSNARISTLRKMLHKKGLDVDP